MYGIIVYGTLFSSISGRSLNGVNVFWLLGSSTGSTSASSASAAPCCAAGGCPASGAARGTFPGTGDSSQTAAENHDNNYYEVFEIVYVDSKYSVVVFSCGSSFIARHGDHTRTFHRKVQKYQPELWCEQRKIQANFKARVHEWYLIFETVSVREFSKGL